MNQPLHPLLNNNKFLFGCSLALFLLVAIGKITGLTVLINFSLTVICTFVMVALSKSDVLDFIVIYLNAILVALAEGLRFSPMLLSWQYYLAFLVLVGCSAHISYLAISGIDPSKGWTRSIELLTFLTGAWIVLAVAGAHLKFGSHFATPAIIVLNLIAVAVSAHKSKLLQKPL